MKDLADIRKEINEIDEQMIRLFKERMDCAKEVGEHKLQNGIPVLNVERENEILDKVADKGGEYGSYARLLYSNIMELSRALQHNIVGADKALGEVIAQADETLPTDGVRVAYQGIKGANGHEATLRLFPNGDAVSYKTFEDVFEAVDRG